MKGVLLHIGVNHYLVLSAILFTIGVIGVITRKDAIMMFMSIELMLNAVNLSFVAFSSFHHVLDGKVFVVFTMAVAAAEAAVGLAIVVLLFRHKGTIEVEKFKTLKE